MSTQISIIIPNRNNAARLEQCLQAVQRECAGRDDVEVIVVDNGSSDEGIQVAKQADVQVMSETGGVSPYLARNRGLEAACGNRIVLLDSNCIPQPGWLHAGLQALEENYQIIAPHFLFDPIADQDYLAKFDALYAVLRKRPGQDIEALPCTNLFIHKEVFTQIGLFDDRFRSLEDIAWTRRAYLAGYRLGLAKAAKVLYPAKTGQQFIRKMLRLGGGKKERALLTNRFWSVSYLAHCVKQFFPPSRTFISRMYQLGKSEGLPIPLGWTVLICYLTKVCRGTGMLLARVNTRLSRDKPVA